jgi:hypothetical protein
MLAPIPGMSLTGEPGTKPWEKEAKYSKPEDALTYHLDRLAEEERGQALLDMLELDMDIVTLTQGLLRGAVMEGVHTIDVSLIIAPVIHEYIKSTAVKAGIDFEEGFDDSDEEARMQVQYQINVKKARKLLEEYDEDSLDESDFDEEPVEELEDTTMTDDQPKGLMARMSKLEGDM